MNTMLTQIKEIQDDGRVFISFKEESNPCADCGLCCKSYRVSFYFGETNEMGGLVPYNLTEKINDFYVCMSGTNQTQKRCIALLENNYCSIYDNRPSCCREFEVWDENGIPNKRCQSLREKHKLPLLENL